ncbi:MULTISPECIES: SDR family NAD(P)-dependent oxidoreductase [unclassified Rathayibacter]|uniref:SDR family NAD(P)-dependent oxidoreductase n=1 Tax=unclassified Rathayibacter TaxID=2609250 RepID=UPI001FB1CBF2|nr:MULTISPECIES: SDR family NAD(P)-dependent oxidoreductase [unclassified Rathayibacter]MCJ1674648.1 SDR family NAD(P)-dependent oxidoreductase [Rathayibacter sp. VKM Ac-2929]MCJ1682757.1 SDR family NAD(P)-dependent oxidoreductase [Rathayibacter sp. VKM Ac-2928]
MSRVVIVSGASSGFGAMTVRELALAGHRVYAGMRAMDGRNAPAAEDARAFAREHGVDLRPVELDVSDQASVDAAVARIAEESERIDVVVHNAGHMVLGPTEAFTVEQLAEVYDVNVLSTQRLNHAVLPILRAQEDGLLVWVGSSSSRGGTPPYLGPYFAAKAAEDALAVGCAVEVARFGIDTVIVVPGSYTTGTNHFAHAGRAARAEIAAAYEDRYPGLMDDVSARLAELAPADADPREIAVEIARVVGLPRGERPFRVVIDPADDGAARVFALGDAVRREFYERMRMQDLLSPADTGVPATTAAQGENR